ncbi:HxlR family transcriptional regulator [Paraburkholderia sp. BL8N3]|nr:helix-turn-helix domain-containing protein [Paraburkholderia sp. BL8N3]TCK33456.1 HxlR family transcriptional regulator [Paraburkholderia sp. BL8N3]
MPRQRSINHEPCPVARSVDVVGDRWSLLIVRDAFDGTHRSGDFQRSLGVARNILSDRPRKLVDAGILETQPASDGTSYQDYILTSRGEGLLPVVVALRQWGERQQSARGERHSVLVNTYTGEPIPYMPPQASDSADLPPASTKVRKLS